MTELEILEENKRIAQGYKDLLKISYKTLTDEEFNIIMSICEQQFMNTNNADPEIYYAELERFKELFKVFKLGF